MKLEGRVALVTGGGVGIGRGIALEMARAGASIAIVDIDPGRAQRAAEAVRETGASAAAIEADVSQRADTTRMVRDAVRELGGLDILVNNAGVSRGMDFLELTDEAWDFVMDTNLKSAFMGTQEAARYWVEEGRGGVVINISSVDDTMPYPHNPHYNASKAGLKMLTQSTALALAEHRIRVNCIGPGICETEITRHLMDSPLWESGGGSEDTVGPRRPARRHRQGRRLSRLRRCRLHHRRHALRRRRPHDRRPRTDHEAVPPELTRKYNSPG